MEWYEALIAYTAISGVTVYAVTRMMSYNHRSDDLRHIDDDALEYLSGLEQQLETNVSAMEHFDTLRGSEKHKNLEMALKALRRIDYRNRETISRYDVESIVIIMEEYGLAPKKTFLK